MELLVKNQIVLNDDQTKALGTLETWLYNPIKTKDESLFFALTGAAGTGKTTLMDSFLKRLKYPINPHRVCICAPTHKAKKVMKEKTNWGNAETLQALLGLKLDTSLDDFDVNNPSFNPIGDRKIKDYDLVLIDESSMINTDLYITICDCAKATGTKVLFVGDIKQLNPVKEFTISPALISPINKYDLTMIVRQSNTNPLILLLDVLRDDIENNTTNYLKYIHNNPSQFNEKGEGYHVMEAVQFASELAIGFNSVEFKENKNHCRYISWTNESISKTNKYIRDKILACNELLQVGELMLSYKTIQDVLVNSDDYVIESITERTKENWEIQTWSVKIKCIDTDIISEVEIVVPLAENYKIYIDAHEQMLDTAKSRRGRAWVDFYKFRDKYILLEPLTTFRYGKNVLVAKKDIDYGYGITIHKSQGSTYNTVYINGKDINRNQTESERLRLWYVALSRASNKAIINL